MKKRYKDIGARIGLAGVGTAIALVFITLAYFVKNLSLSFTIIAAAGVMFPLAKGYFREGLLVSVAASGLGFLIANISVVSYVLASSFYVVFTIFLMKKNFNVLLGYAIKIAYSCLAFYILYKLVSLISVDFSKISFLQNLPEYGLYIVLNLIFTLVFLVYDFLLQKCFDELTRLLEKSTRNR